MTAPMNSGLTLAMYAGGLALIGICALTLAFTVMDYLEKRRRRLAKEADQLTENYRNYEGF